MKRFLLKIEYDGTQFVGWQRQTNGLGVQEVIENAVEQLSNEKVFVQCAGRTDSGVHALGQAAHFDLSQDWEPNKLRDGINYYLKKFDVSIIKAHQVDKTFNARFNAIQRSYEYLILNRRPPAAINRGKVWWVPVKLDTNVMQQAGRILVGKHDFSTFRASECQSRSPIKTLDKLTITNDGDQIRIIVSARSFLYHQVRNMVGTLRLVGEKKWTLERFESAFDARDRSSGGPTAPACGLYFTDVKYV